MAEARKYARGYVQGVAEARADVARLLWAALGESPQKNSDLVEIALRVRALREGGGYAPPEQPGTDA